MLARVVPKLVKSRTPWKQTDEIEHELQPGKVVTLQQLAPIHIVSHGFCLTVYLMLLATYSVFSFVMFINEEPVENFSTVQAKEFGPVPLQVTVSCVACSVASGGLAAKIGTNRKWALIYSYEGVGDCEEVGNEVIADVESTTVPLCRSTDDISDNTGIRVRLENVSDDLRFSKGRPTVDVSNGDLSVSTPLEPWHEKTLLLGVTVQRDVEDCISSSDCDLKVGLYLASMQYDGRVNRAWGGAGWAGAQLNIRMLRFAHVYTIVPQRTFLDVIATIGGASGILIMVLGALLKVIEAVVIKKEGRAVSVREAAVVIGQEAGAQVLDNQ
eukprot:TRINITY_DN9943_c0_g1_i1.p1 TRINITY_DN9943_c0_g1~~TRINITY_DN9943_c0_g1_i1.p1  ORF type:complete len:349 (+),score=39.30 TRINITY_DN9943_c0_g1_i1:68-1048(+)